MLPIITLVMILAIIIVFIIVMLIMKKSLFTLSHNSTKLPNSTQILVFMDKPFQSNCQTTLSSDPENDWHKRSLQILLGKEEPWRYYDNAY